jgi:hypothetical protein
MKAQNLQPVVLISNSNQSNDPPAQTANNTLMGNSKQENNTASTRQIEDQVNNLQKHDNIF